MIAQVHSHELPSKRGENKQHLTDASGLCVRIASVTADEDSCVILRVAVKPYEVQSVVGQDCSTFSPGDCQHGGVAQPYASQAEYPSVSTS